MRIVLFLLSVLSFFVGGLVFIESKSAVHEIEAFVLFLIAATLLSAAAIVEAINRKKADLNRIESLLEKISAPSADLPPRLEPVAESLPLHVKGDRYHVRIASGTEGPYPVWDIRKLLERGAISADTLVRGEGSPGWRTVEVMLSNESDA